MKFDYSSNTFLPYNLWGQATHLIQTTNVELKKFFYFLQYIRGLRLGINYIALRDHTDVIYRTKKQNQQRVLGE